MRLADSDAVLGLHLRVLKQTLERDGRVLDRRLSALEVRVASMEQKVSGPPSPNRQRGLELSLLPSGQQRRSRSGTGLRRPLRDLGEFLGENAALMPAPQLFQTPVVPTARRARSSSSEHSVRVSPPLEEFQVFQDDQEEQPDEVHPEEEQLEDEHPDAEEEHLEAEDDHQEDENQSDSDGGANGVIAMLMAMSVNSSDSDDEVSDEDDDFTLDLVADEVGLFREEAGGFIGVLKTAEGFEKFSGFGESSWKSWKGRFLDLLDASPQVIPDERRAKILKCYVSGPARAFLDSLDPTATFDDMLGHLEGKFDNDTSRSVARMRLKQCRQESDEKVLVFANRLSNLVREVVDPTNKQAFEERMMQEFIDKTHGQIAFHLHILGMTSFDDCLQKAQAIEGYLSAHPERAGGAVMGENRTIAAAAPPMLERTQPDTRPSQEALRQYRAENNQQRQGRAPRNFQNRSSGGQGRPRRAIQCYGCGRQGHMVRECRSTNGGRNIPFQQQSFSNGRSNQNRGGAQGGRFFNQNSGSRRNEDTMERLERQVQCLQMQNQSLANMLYGDEPPQDNAVRVLQVDSLAPKNGVLFQDKVPTEESSFFKSISNRRSSVTSFPFWFTVLALLSMFLPLAAASHPELPMVCQTSNSRYFLSLNKTMECKSPSIIDSDTRERKNISLYRPNTMRFDTKAYYCKIVKSTGHYYRSLFGEETSRYEMTVLPVSREECRMMIEHKRCNHGIMTESNGKWQTNASYQFQWSGSMFDRCYWQKEEITNCYLVESSVHSVFGSQLVFSPIGDFHRCSYTDGICPMDDGAMTMWSPAQLQQCPYVKVAEMAGTRISGVWLDDKGEFGLTWDEKDSWLHNCGVMLIITHQGYGISYDGMLDYSRNRLEEEQRNKATQTLSIRTRRQLHNGIFNLTERHKKDEFLFMAEVGLVTSNQLAAQMLAVEHHIRNSTAFAFQRAFTAACNVWRTQVVAQRSLFLLNPTLSVRALTGHAYIHAKAASTDFIEVWPCAAIQPHDFEFVVMDKDCREYPKVAYKSGSETRFGYLEPKTLIIREDAPRTECYLVNEIPLKLYNRTMVYIARTGELQPVVKSMISDVIDQVADAIDIAEFPLRIFSNMVLANYSELLQVAAYGSNHRVIEINDVIERRAHNVDPRNFTDGERFKIVNGVLVTAGHGLVNSFARKIEETSLMSLVFGGMPSAWEFWTLLVNIVVTLKVTFSVGMFLLWAYTQAQTAPAQFMTRCKNSAMGNLFTNLYRLRNRRPSTRASSVAPSFIVRQARAGTPAPLAMQTLHFDDDTVTEEEYYGHWRDQQLPLRRIPSIPLPLPPAPSVESLNSTFEDEGENAVMSICAIGNFSAQVPGSANGVFAYFLVDTGAVATIGSTALLPLLRIDELDTASVPQLFGVGGTPVNITGSKVISISLAGKTIQHRVHFSPDAISPSKVSYNFILGCDFLQKLSPLELDFEKRMCRVGSVQVPMGKPEIGRTAYTLRVMAPVVVPPNAEKFIDCSIDVAGKVKPVSRVFEVSQTSDKLACRNVQVAPCITRRHGLQKVTVLLTNLSDEPVKLYPKQSVATGNQVFKSKNGVWRPLGRVAEELKEVTQYSGIYAVSEEQEQPAMPIDLSRSDISEEERSKLLKLVQEYEDVFSRNKYDLGSFNGGEFKIKTTTEKPMRYHERPIPYRYRDEVNQHFDELLKAGVVKESDTPWLSNIVCVQKKDNSLRCCLDFRGLNQISLPDMFPLPPIHDILNKIGGKGYYTTLDASSGYHQLRLDEESSYKCGVKTDKGIYQFTSVPFGLKAAGSFYCRAMSKILRGLESIALNYIDDVLVYSDGPSFDDHLDALRQVFDRLRQFNLKLSPKKCEFAKKKLIFLGHQIEQNHYCPGPDNVKAIREFPHPKTVREVKRFIGMCSFFRRFQPNFAKTMEPLHKLTRNTKKLVWNEEAEVAFVTAREALCKEPILRYPDFNREFFIFTDASSVSMGAALMQKDPETNAFYAISYSSRVLSASERRWPAVQAELGAIVYAVRTFRPFIFQHKTTVMSDHRPLAFLMENGKSHANLARWAIELQSYDITIKYFNGKQNTVADALSRMNEDSEEPAEGEVPDLEDKIEYPVCLVLHQAVAPSPAAAHQVIINLKDRRVDLAKEQRKSPRLNEIFRSVEQSGSGSGNYRIGANGLLLRVNDHRSAHGGSAELLPVIPSHLIPVVLEAFHSNPMGGGHFCAAKTYAKVAKKYFWDGRYRDVRNFCDSCPQCELRRRPHPAYREPMVPVLVGGVMAKVGLDLSGPFPVTESGNKYILNCICWFTRFVISIPLPDGRASTLADALVNQVIARYGFMAEIVSDNARAFSGEFFNQVCETLKVHHIFSSPYHSQGNGATERTFRTFQDILSKYIRADQTDWDKWLNWACFAYNVTDHASTRESPYYLMFGRQPMLPIDHLLGTDYAQTLDESDLGEFKSDLATRIQHAWSIAQQFAEIAHKTQKATYDKNVRASEIKIGDRVLLKSLVSKPGLSKKLANPWSGQFRVVRLDPPLHAVIQSCAAPKTVIRKVHLNQIKKCTEAIPRPVVTFQELPEVINEALDEAGATPETVPGLDYSIPSGLPKSSPRPSTVTQAKSQPPAPSRPAARQRKSRTVMVPPQVTRYNLRSRKPANPTN